MSCFPTFHREPWHLRIEHGLGGGAGQEGGAGSISGVCALPAPGLRGLLSLPESVKKQ